jgi:hypothetical protein
MTSVDMPDNVKKSLEELRAIQVEITGLLKGNENVKLQVCDDSYLWMGQGESFVCVGLVDGIGNWWAGEECRVVEWKE